MLTVCCPTLNRYDLLVKMIDSANEGTVVPDKFMIVDNGGKLKLGEKNVEVFRPGYNLGVAASWNILIRNSSEYRIIVNDDIVFNLDTIELMMRKVELGAKIVTCNGYSCFMIQDSLIEEVGYFDEDLSPGYAYFEDCDYSHRIKLRGMVEESVPICKHGGSMTIRVKGPDSVKDHARRFDLARVNYVKKWGGYLGSEVNYY